MNSCLKKKVRLFIYLTLESMTWTKSDFSFIWPWNQWHEQNHFILYGNSASQFIISTLFKCMQTIMCSHLFFLKVHWLSPSTFRDLREFPSSRGHRSEKSRTVNYLGNLNAWIDICSCSITNYIIIEPPYCITATHYTIHFGSFQVEKAQ